jgi:hypothetical protein
MPSLLTHIACRACGNEHNFASLQGNLEVGREYGYFCPRRGVMATLVAGSAGAAVEHPPQGTVVLMATVSHGRRSKSRPPAIR